MHRAEADAPIGGYFDLEHHANAGLPWLDTAAAYQSARAGLAAAVIALQPATVWVPHYICPAVTDALDMAGATIRRYPLNSALEVPEHLPVGMADLVLCVDYFGLHAAAIDTAITRFGAAAVLVDASQALFHEYRPGTTTVYSLRKFLGLPDGGLVRTPASLAHARDADERDSIARSQHLLYRLANLTQAGYEKFQQAEMSLLDCEPVAMSRLTRALLQSVNLSDVAVARTRNYKQLASLLRATAGTVPELRGDAVPLCCPLRIRDAADVRKALAARNIFTPTYWADAQVPVNDPVALSLRDETVFLPCDQRYGTTHMQRVANAIVEIMETS